MMVLEDRWLRETYVDLLIEYAAKNKDIVILEADSYESWRNLPLR